MKVSWPTDFVRLTRVRFSTDDENGLRMCASNGFHSDEAGAVSVVVCASDRRRGPWRWLLAGRSSPIVRNEKVVCHIRC